MLLWEFESCKVAAPSSVPLRFEGMWEEFWAWRTEERCANPGPDRGLGPTPVPSPASDPPKPGAYPRDEAGPMEARCEAVMYIFWL